jgi:hypothetical protein
MNIPQSKLPNIRFIRLAVEAAPSRRSSFFGQILATAGYQISFSLLDRAARRLRNRAVHHRSAERVPPIQGEPVSSPMTYEDHHQRGQPMAGASSRIGVVMGWMEGATPTMAKP